MLIWINGSFGGGKTQTAYELARRLPGSVVCDPEHVGFGLHRMLPAALRGDFQDLSAWRQGVFEMLELTLREYFVDTVGRLRERGFGHAVRIVGGQDAPLRRESFAVGKLDLCLERLRAPQFAEQVWTDERTVPQVAEHLATATAGLPIEPSTDSRLRGRLRRTWTGIRHIRFD